MTWLWLMILLSIISLLSIYWLRKKMSPLGLILCYMFAYIATSISGLIINMNLKLTQTPEQPLIFWTQKLAELFPKTILIIWVVVIVFSQRNIFSKMVGTFVILMALNGFELFFNQIGYLQFLKWNMLYSSLRYISILFLVIAYNYLLQKFREKERVFK